MKSFRMVATERLVEEIKRDEDFRGDSYDDHLGNMMRSNLKLSHAEGWWRIDAHAATDKSRAW